MIGVGEPAVGAVASATVSLAIKGSGGGKPLIDSILIDFTPVKFSPKAEAAIFALPYALVTACFKRSFLIASDLSSERLKYMLLTSLTPDRTAVSIHCEHLKGYSYLQ